jgi:hypothetical protein
LQNLIIENCLQNGVNVERSHLKLKNTTIRYCDGKAVVLNVCFGGTNGRANISFSGDTSVYNNGLMVFMFIIQRQTVLS